MAIQDSDLLYVQRPSGDDAGGYKITAGDLLNSPVIVSDTAPTDSDEGDLWWADTDEDEGGGRLYVYKDGQWVDTSLPGGALTETEGDRRYLSRLNDDTAEGAITFEGLTTHESGVNVTGGDSASINNKGLYGTSNALVLEGPNEVFLKSAGQGQFKVDSVGRAVKVMDSITNRNGGFIAGYTKNMPGYATDKPINNNPGDPVDGNSAAISYSTSMSTAKNIGALCGYAARVTDTSGGTINQVFGYYSSINEASTYTGINETYGFYSAGTAKNYFRGVTIHESGVNVTGGGTETSLYNNAGAFRIKTTGGEAIRITDRTSMLFGNPGHRGDMNFRFGADMQISGGEPNACLDVAAIIKSGSNGSVGAFNTKGVNVESGANLNVLAGYYAYQPEINGTVTTSAGFYSDYSDINQYNFYAEGNAPNYFAGNTYFGGNEGSDTSIYLSARGRVRIHRPGSSKDSAPLDIRRTKADAEDTWKGIEFWKRDETDRVSMIRLNGETVRTIDFRLGATGVAMADGAADIVKALQPKVITQGGETFSGFLPADLAETYAEAMEGEAGATVAVGTYTDADGVAETDVEEPETLAYGETWEQTGVKDLMQGVCRENLIPLLTKALQEALARIEQLEADHATMMNNNGGGY